MRRSVLTAARLLTDDVPAGGFRYRPAMVTLTYRDADGWSPDHVRDFLQRVRVWAKRKGFRLRYVWVAELQRRGALHYHVIVWLPFSMPMPDRRGWWSHGSTRVEWARSAVGYLAKYAAKADGGGGVFPRGARIHGAGGLTEGARRVRRWWMYPRELRASCTPSHDVVRLKGGGYVSRALGVILPPMWGLVSVGGGRVRLLRLHDGWPALPPVAHSFREERREVAAFGRSQRESGSSLTSRSSV